MSTRSILIAFFILAVFGGQTAVAVETGAAMPECKLTSLADNQNAELSQFKGKVVYVDFWASWCGPCAKSFPFMNELHRQLNDRGFQIVGVNLDENPADAKEFLAKYPAEFTVLADASEEKRCAKDFNVQAMPSSYLIDREGKVHHVHLGFKPGEAQDVRVMVEKLLSGNRLGKSGIRF